MENKFKEKSKAVEAKFLKANLYTDKVLTYLVKPLYWPVILNKNKLIREKIKNIEEKSKKKIFFINPPENIHKIKR